MPILGTIASQISGRLGRDVEYLVLGGGGGGGANHGGGGGGGGFLNSTLKLPVGTAFTVTVGAGGVAGTFNGSPTGTSGNNSVLHTVTALGGGRGGDYSSNYEAQDGGSGGGAQASGTSYIGKGFAGPPRQGYDGGGKNPNFALCGGGGGGASAAGQTQTGSQGGGNGGNGAATSITGSSVTYGGGGGGGGWNGSVSVGTQALGGTGGGGNAGPTVQSGGSNGTGGTNGLGGGGGCGGGGTSNGGAGGTGVVVIAYPDTFPAPSSISGGLTYDQPSRSGYRVYRFTAGTGTVTF